MWLISAQHKNQVAGGDVSSGEIMTSAVGLAYHRNLFFTALDILGKAGCPKKELITEFGDRQRKSCNLFYLNGGFPFPGPSFSSHSDTSLLPHSYPDVWRNNHSP